MQEDIKNRITDMVEIGAKTGLSTIPIGGPLFSAVYDSIKSNAAQKRLNEWQLMIETRITKLETTLEDLGKDENFTSAIFIATESAIKTAEQAKREYLANAVINSIKCPLEESIIMMFFDMAGKYTLWHLKVLDYFENPKKFHNAENHGYAMGSPMTLLYEVYPEFESDKALVNRIIKELYNDGLLSTENMNVTMTGSGMLQSRVTDLGSRFIKFLIL